jgi:hypothetical protein
MKNKNVLWNTEQELLLKKWAEYAICYNILHNRAHKKYLFINTWLNIPIIIINNLTGSDSYTTTLNIIQFNKYIYIFSLLNIISNILKSIINYINLNDKINSHYLSSIEWDKFSNKIELELSKQRYNRIHPNDFLNTIINDYNILIEKSPIITSDIINWYNKNMKNNFNNNEPFTICNCLCYELIYYISKYFEIILCNYCRRNKNEKKKKITPPKFINPIIISKEKKTSKNKLNVNSLDKINIIIKKKNINKITKRNIKKKYLDNNINDNKKIIMKEYIENNKTDNIIQENNRTIKYNENIEKDKFNNNNEKSEYLFLSNNNLFNKNISCDSNSSSDDSLNNKIFININTPSSDDSLKNNKIFINSSSSDNKNYYDSNSSSDNKIQSDSNSSSDDKIQSDSNPSSENKIHIENNSSSDDKIQFDSNQSSDNKIQTNIIKSDDKINTDSN